GRMAITDECVIFYPRWHTVEFSEQQLTPCAAPESSQVAKSIHNSASPEVVPDRLRVTGRSHYHKNGCGGRLTGDQRPAKGLKARFAHSQKMERGGRYGNLARAWFGRAMYLPAILTTPGSVTTAG